MNEQNQLKERKAAFLKLYKERRDITMFQAATQSALSVETLTSELRADKDFFAQVQELCGQRLKDEITAYQNNKKDHEEDTEGAKQPRPGNN